MKSRGFLQISFAWLFAIIIGAIILFFAIYASVRLIETEGTISSTEAGKEITVLLNPLETGFGEETTTPLSLSVESRINNGCEEPGFTEFGEQGIIVSQKISGRWAGVGLETVAYNKYVFSNGSVQGKNFYLFSKPLEMPFKVADLIMLTSAEETYCFDDAPDEIKEELSDLGQGNIFTEGCPQKSIRVCFEENNGCDIEVDVFDRSVTKMEEKVYYETDALMYAAIFSDAETYECQVKRLMARLEQLALIYNDKEAILATKGCAAQVSLLGLASSASSLQDSFALVTVKAAAESAEADNRRAYCELW